MPAAETPRKAHKVKQMVSRLYSWADENDLVAEGFIVRKAANLDARNPQLETPLHRAVEKGMLVLVRALAAAVRGLRRRLEQQQAVLGPHAGNPPADVVAHQRVVVLLGGITQQ